MIGQNHNVDDSKSDDKDHNKYECNETYLWVSQKEEMISMVENNVYRSKF